MLSNFWSLATILAVSLQNPISNLTIFGNQDHQLNLVGLPRNLKIRMLENDPTPTLANKDKDKVAPNTTVM